MNHLIHVLKQKTKLNLAIGLNYSDVEDPKTRTLEKAEKKILIVIRSQGFRGKPRKYFPWFAEFSVILRQTGDILN